MASATYSSQADMAILQSVFHKHLFKPSDSLDPLFAGETNYRLMGTMVSQLASEPSELNWKRVHYAIRHFLVNGEGGLVTQLPGLKVVLTSPEGRVTYDSDAQNNSFMNVILDAIGENQNTRSSVLQAVLGNSGVGFEVKSGLVGTQLVKKAYHVQRVGPSPANVLGCIILSVNTHH